MPYLKRLNFLAAALACPLLALAPAAQGAQFDDLLTTLDPKTFTGSAADFLKHVTWVDTPEPARYQCREDNRGTTVLELWRGRESRSRDRFGEQALVYGHNGEVQVFAVHDDNGKPRTAAYFMLPSGDTYLFRLDFSASGVTKSGKPFQCEQV